MPFLPTWAADLPSHGQANITHSGELPGVDIKIRAEAGKVLNICTPHCPLQNLPGLRGLPLRGSADGTSAGPLPRSACLK